MGLVVPISAPWEAQLKGYVPAVQASMEMIVPRSQAWRLTILMGLMLHLGPCIQYANCKNATHIRKGFPTALIILKPWYVQDEKHQTVPMQITLPPFWQLNISTK